MMKFRKPRIGLLGLMTDGYEAAFPGIIERQTSYANEIVKTLSPAVDVIFDGPGLNRDSIEQRVRDMNDKGADGILIILLAYSQGAWLLRALQQNRLPVALAVVQPDQEVHDDWYELDLTVNQGIHGAQDNANVIMRSGVKCEFFVGNRHESEFVGFVEDFGKACLARKKLLGMRTALFSRMCGMGDILTDDMAFFKKAGPEFCHDTLGSIYKLFQHVTKKQIDEQISLDHSRFEVDPKLKYESHSEAVKYYLAFRKFLEDKQYDAFTAHFDAFGDDGRFRQLPLYAASNLLADGYGYAAEGDAVCASMVAAAHFLGDNNANFTEMYTMDFSKNAIIFCHAGEGNWKTCREDMKPRLIDRYLGEGGLENPPTHIFTPKAGPSTLTSMVSVDGSKFRLVLAKGAILQKSDMTNCEMPYLFWQPETGIRECVKGWLKNGGTHHEVINIGNIASRWRMLCNMMDIEYVEV